MSKRDERRLASAMIAIALEAAAQTARSGGITPDIEDVAQDAVTKVWQVLDRTGQFDNTGGGFPGYVATAARRSFVDRVRKDNRAPVVPLDFEHHEGFANVDTAAPAVSAVAELTNRLKGSVGSDGVTEQTIYAAALEADGYGGDEIALHLGVPRETLRKRRQRLKQRWMRLPGGSEEQG